MDTIGVDGIGSEMPEGTCDEVSNGKAKEVSADCVADSIGQWIISVEDVSSDDTSEDRDSVWDEFTGSLTHESNGRL